MGRDYQATDSTNMILQNDFFFFKSVFPNYLPMYNLGII